MSQADFEGLLRAHIGLDVASVGPELIARAVHERRLACQLEDSNAYWEHVSSSATERQELIEAVVVPETWFFRHREAFAALVQHAHEHSRSQPDAQLRLLSVPCATGEEAYSMAIALLEAGMPEQRFAIDAVDISARGLERACHAVYGNNAFRDPDLGFRDRHFEAVGRSYRLSGRVQRAVKFQQGNLLSLDAVLGATRYDVIFCRNVLIYLDATAQRRALHALRDLLNEAGQLFVGPAETSVVSSATFVSTRVPLAFAFRKGQPRGESARRAGSAPIVALPSEGVKLARRAPALNVPSKPRVVQAPPRLSHAASAPASNASAHLQRVAELADRGHLIEAARLCTEHLALHGPSARLFYVMGLLREAAHDPEQAAALHKKALYLDPDHGEALIHLALLVEKQGDAAAAERLRRRARRVPPTRGGA
jgi:chemotaxis protein methyltransferase WspC